MSRFVEAYIEQAVEILRCLDTQSIDELVLALAALRETPGRLFLVGVGGSSANCMHAANDFRKICKLEAYSLTDNVAELTAWTNDNGWPTVFMNLLNVSRLGPLDALLVFSVSGGTGGVSENIAVAVQMAKARGAKVYGIVSRDGGATAEVADICIKIPVLYPEHVTPHAEAVQAVIWHCLVSHPALQSR